MATPGHLAFQIELRREVNVQKLDGTLLVLFDVDADDDTGSEEHGMAGCDLVLEMTPPGRGRRGGMGMGLRTAGSGRGGRLSPYDLNLHMAPTYASDRVEFRIDRGLRERGLPVAFADDAAELRFVAVDTAGTVVDETDVIRVDLPSLQPHTPREHATDPLTRTDDSLRVVNWNVERGNMFDDSRRFARILRSLQPDVVLLQELTNKHSAGQVANFFNTALTLDDDRTWNVLFAAGGGNLRTAIVTRHALTPVEPFHTIGYPGQSYRTIRQCGGIVSWRDQNLFFCSLHLKCCGSIGSEEDDRRMTEVQQIVGTFRKLPASLDVDGCIVGGDFNLVGGRRPILPMYRAMPDRIGNLAPAGAMHLDDATNITWWDGGSSFVPGRLDYILYTPDHLELARAFVLDTTDLAPKWLDHHGLQPFDTEQASDHLPIVVDIRPIGGTR